RERKKCNNEARHYEPLNKHVECFERTVQDCRSVLETQPTGNHGRIHTAKISRVDEIVAFIKLRQAWNLSIMSAFDLLACNKHQVRRSMVGAEAGVLRHAASKLGKNHYGDIIGTSD